MSDKNVRLMDELMQAVTQTDEWNEIQENDPEIKRAGGELFGLLSQIQGMLPHEQYLKIEYAILGYANAVSSAAMLYGMHIIDVIRDVSRHIMERTGGGQRNDKIMAGGNLDNIVVRLIHCRAVLDTVQMAMGAEPLVAGVCDLLESITQDFQAAIDGAEDYMVEDQA